MRCVIPFCAFVLLTSADLGHHGWSSYDASKTGNRHWSDLNPAFQLKATLVAAGLLRQQLLHERLRPRFLRR
jgi:hypothetical protein